MDQSVVETLDRLAEDLAHREGDLPVDNDYQLPSLEPLSHEHPLLSATTPEFDVERFLLSRSHTSLPDLRVELRDYLAELKDELVQLINDDYQAFISLSTDLRGEGARLEKIHAPLGAVKDEIEKSSSELLALEASVQTKLRERARLREEKALLRLLFNLLDSVTRLESLLLIPSPEDAEQSSEKPTSTNHNRPVDDDVDDKTRTGSRAKHLSRVAAEFVQLLYQAEKARSEECAFVYEIQWRIDRIKETLSRDLDQLFGNALEAISGGTDTSTQERVRLISDLSECFKTYDLLDTREEAEEIIRVRVVHPFVRKSIFTGALNVPHSPILPRTPFMRTVSSTSVPGTPYTPITPYPGQRRGTLRSHFFVAEDNARLPLLEEEDDQLSSLYNNILRFVEKNCVEVMEISRRINAKHGKRSGLSQDVSTPNSGYSLGDDAHNKEKSSRFEIMANVVWAEIGRALMEELGAVIFAAGKPSEFKDHFATTKAFISALEFLAPDLEAVHIMRVHPVYLAFERRWQLPVYFQLRSKEIISELEMMLGENRSRVSLEYDVSSGSRQAFAVIEAISRCWSPDVYILELGHRFWKLTLQIIGRYKNWLEESLPTREATPLVAAAIREEKATISRTETPPPGAESPNPSLPNDEDRLRQLAIILTDVKVVSERVLKMWKDEVVVAIDIPNEDSLEDILRESLGQLTTMVPYLTSQIVLILGRRCSEPVAQVKQLDGQMRALSRRREPPNAASAFVAEILKPLREFFGMSSVVVGGAGAPTGNPIRGIGKALREEYAAKWTTEILDIVATRYASYLESMRKNKEALIRMKKGARTGRSMFGKGSGTSAQDEFNRDEERLRAQMVLDVDRLGKDAEALGATLDEVTSYQALTVLAAQGIGDLQ